jgi:hypothetical protein
MRGINPRFSLYLQPKTMPAPRGLAVPQQAANVVDEAGRDGTLANAKETTSRLAQRVAIEGCDAARCRDDHIAGRALAGARAG